jgi:hypothetical protein
MWTSHWHWSKTSCNSYSVCLFVSILFLSFSFDKLLILIFSFLNIETKDWHQKFLQNVLRNLLNWCECVGRNNLNNVLYLFFVSVSLFQTHISIWFVSSLIEMFIVFRNDLSIFRTIKVILFNVQKEDILEFQNLKSQILLFILKCSKQLRIEIFINFTFLPSNYNILIDLSILFKNTQTK